MKPYVITISRQFGSMGRSIAEQLAKKLNINFYDRDIVEETSKRLGLPISVISEKEEFESNKYFIRKYPLGMGVTSLQDEIFMVQKNIIEDLSNKESCIIVGRCASGILANKDNVLNVYIYAPYESRVKNCIERLGMTEAVAKKLIKEVDHSRKLYHKEYCPNFKDDMSNKDIIIDSSKFDIEGTVDILESIVKLLYFKNSSGE